MHSCVSFPSYEHNTKVIIWISTRGHLSCWQIRYVHTQHADTHAKQKVQSSICIPPHPFGQRKATAPIFRTAEYSLRFCTQNSVLIIFMSRKCLGETSGIFTSDICTTSGIFLWHFTLEIWPLTLLPQIFLNKTCLPLTRL